MMYIEIRIRTTEEGKIMIDLESARDEASPEEECVCDQIVANFSNYMQEHGVPQSTGPRTN